MDNRYWENGCPALMQDGRFITNYTRFNVTDQFIKNVNEITSIHDYKSFLQKNGDTILNREKAKLEELNTCKVNGKCVPLSGKGNLNVLPCPTCHNN